MIDKNKRMCETCRWMNGKNPKAFGSCMRIYSSCEFERTPNGQCGTSGQFWEPRNYSPKFLGVF